MNEQEKREKVFKGLAACMPQTEEDAEIGCGGCPYNGNPCGGDYQDNDHVNLPVRMIEDIRALLKAQEAVDTVPVEWLRERKHWAAIDGDHWAENIISHLLDAWQKEQEANT